MFHSRLWRGALKALGIRHLFGPVMQPWRNGRVERFMGTLKAAFGGSVLSCADAVQRGLNAFADHYNIARPHLALGGLTPHEVWQGRTMADVQIAHGLAEDLLMRMLEGFARPRP